VEDTRSTRCPEATAVLFWLMLIAYKKESEGTVVVVGDDDEK
jgi:hypothetical protein